MGRARPWDWLVSAGVIDDVCLRAHGHMRKARERNMGPSSDGLEVEACALMRRGGRKRKRRARPTQR